MIDAGRVLGVAVEPRRFPEGTKTAADAAAAIGCEVGQIVKSLIFGVDWGNLPLALLVLLLFSLVAAGAAILLGTLLENEGALPPALV